MISTTPDSVRRLVLSVDYEIYGNGSGDVRQHVVEPAHRMAAIAEKYGVPLVIFFELEECLAFERHAAALQRHLGCDPAALMRDQARDLVRRGLYDGAGQTNGQLPAEGARDVQRFQSGPGERTVRFRMQQ